MPKTQKNIKQHTNSKRVIGATRKRLAGLIALLLITITTLALKVGQKIMARLALRIPKVAHWYPGILCGFPGSVIPDHRRSKQQPAATFWSGAKSIHQKMVRYLV
jgi:hypothetical protein